MGLVEDFYGSLGKSLFNGDFNLNATSGLMDASLDDCLLSI